MTRKTVKLPENEYEKHNAQRKEMGLTWAEYIDGQAAKLVNADELADEIVERIAN